MELAKVVHNSQIYESEATTKVEKDHLFAYMS